MYKYAKGINSIKELDNVNIYASDNSSVCMALSGALEARKKSHGLYIENGKVLVSNVFERIEVGDKIYKLYNLNTKSKTMNTQEYIESIDGKNLIWKYILDNGLKLTKMICFEKGTSLMQIKYIIENDTDSKADFIVLPLVTNRDFNNMRFENQLKFNQRKTEKGVIINLSVTTNTNIIMKSPELKYSQNKQNLCNVKHISSLDDEELIEDLFKPGDFKIQIKKGETREVNLFICSMEFELCEDLNDLFEKKERLENKYTKNIEKEFIELKDLALGLEICNMDSKIIPSLPYSNEYSKLIIDSSGIRLDSILCAVKKVNDITRAIEGQYLLLNKVKEARVVLIKIRRFIREVDGLKLDDSYVLKEITLLKLWFVESINRLFSKGADINVFVPQIKEIIVDTLNNKNKELVLEDLECVCLIYNALKIYENIVSHGIGEEIVAYNTYKKLDDLIENEFWDSENNVLRNNVNDKKSVATISMIYSISLSYPCIIGNMRLKVLDTIFRELYTPYGLREISQKSEKYDGNIYPKYMAHFLKANFRQNGVTRATQKLAYNLVKELLQDVSKNENGGIKKVYNDKKRKYIDLGYDILTNAEMVRVYNMLI
ncbi:glycogen debranching enzyme [Clostridium sp. CAG:1219]|nr:glycogen debranching enzyme [Clostridium sp. CAG:1219]